MAQNVCVVPHPEEERPCLTRFAHSLEECPQCGGTVFVEEGELEKLLADLENEKPKRSRRRQDPAPTKEQEDTSDTLTAG